MKVDEILYHPLFAKDLRKLTPEQVELAGVAEDKFRVYPLDQSLGLHKLGGRLKTAWAIKVTHSIRIIFVPGKLAGQVIFLSVGGHDLYGEVHRRLRD